MKKVDTNWFDKVISSLSEFRIGQTTKYDVYAIKVLFSVSSGLYILCGAGVLKDIGLFSIPRSYLLPPGWLASISLFAICYIPIHFLSSRAEIILSCTFSFWEKWFYIVLGWILIGGWGFLVIWPIPALIR
jgi:hypothetical protein